MKEALKEEEQVTISPINNTVYAVRQYASQELIDKVINKSTTAQQQWRNISIEQRGKYCHQMVDAFIKNEIEIAEQLCWMTGRPIRYCTGEVAGMAERARYMIDTAEKCLADKMVAEQAEFTHYIKREPLGITLVISPWNYPYLTAINIIIPAIMAGNSVILKPSSQTPLIAEQLAKAFKAIALPKDIENVFQYLHLNTISTDVLINRKEVNYVAFTGANIGDEMVERISAGRFIGLNLEIGGKGSAYIRDDADINIAVESCIDGAFFNSGQSCCGIERIYVHSSVYDEFIEKAVLKVNRYVLGRSDDPDTTLGPMVKKSSADIVRKQIADAVSAGAVPCISSDNFPLKNLNDGYLAPQILINVDHSMSVMTEESFGPVVGIMKVDSDEQAIALMNDAEFGLTASVYSHDIEKSVTIGEQIETGTFFVNRCDYLNPALAWSGVKNANSHCSLSCLGYESLARPKSFHIKRVT